MEDRFMMAPQICPNWDHDNALDASRKLEVAIRVQKLNRLF
jgi:hypothetical protein